MKRLLYAAFVALVISGCTGRRPHTVILELAATSDVHGNCFPFDFTAEAGTPADGSLARVAPRVRELRKKFGERLLCFDIGDMLQGSPLTYQDKTADFSGVSVCASVMNDIGYDAVTIGNHDLESGMPTLDKHIRSCGFPLLCANLFYGDTQQTWLDPYCIIERDGVRIAVVGMSTPYASFKIPPSNIEGYRFRGIEETAAKLIPYIQENEHPDLIVGLFHSGLDGGKIDGSLYENETMTTAVNVPGFDIIFYGHDHIASCRKFENCAGDSVLLINPGPYAECMALVDVEVDIAADTVSQIRINGHLEDVCGVEPDAKMLDGYSGKIESVWQYQDSVVGSVGVCLDTHEALFGQSGVTDFFNTLLLAMNGNEICISSPYSSDLRIAAGNVKLGEVWELYPYENCASSMWMRGSELVDVLEYFSGRWVNTISTAADTLLKVVETNGVTVPENRVFDFMTAGGVNYTIDVTKPVGERVRILSMADGTPFDETRYYRTGISSFLSCGGYSPFNEAIGLTGEELREREIISTMADFRYHIITRLSLDRESHRTTAVKRIGSWKFIPEDMAAAAFRLTPLRTE